MDRLGGARLDAVTPEKGLCPGLAPLQPRRRLRRAERFEPAGGKLIHQASRERRFGADDGEVEAFGRGEPRQGAHVERLDWHVRGCAAIARSKPDVDTFRDQMPGDGMLAPARADDQDLHVLPARIVGRVRSPACSTICPSSAPTLSKRPPSMTRCWLPWAAG